MPVKVRRQIPVIEGNSDERAKDILAFGLPGRSETHLFTTIAHEKIRNSFSAGLVG